MSSKRSNDRQLMVPLLPFEGLLGAGMTVIDSYYLYSAG